MTFSPEQNIQFLLAVTVQAQRLHAESPDGRRVDWSELDDLQQQAWAWNACQTLGQPLERWRVAISTSLQPGQTVKQLLSTILGPGSAKEPLANRAV